MELMFTISLIGTLIFTMFGSLLSFVTNKINKRVMSIVQGFALGSLISMLFLDIIVEGITSFNTLNYGYIYALLVVLLTFILLFLMHFLFDKYVNKEEHEEHHDCEDHDVNFYNKKTFFFSFLVFILSITIHNIPEGLSLGVTFASNTNLGITMSLLMIGVHNLIVGFMISQSFLEYKNNKLQAFLITSLVGLISYIFVIVGYYTYSINELSSSIMLCISAGALLYVLLKELLPVYFNKYYDSYSLISIIVGICLIAGLIFGLE